MLGLQERRVQPADVVVIFLKGNIGMPVCMQLYCGLTTFAEQET